MFQLQYVVSEGSYLAHRWERAQHCVNLYHLPDSARGFFAEVDYDEVLIELRMLNYGC